MDLRPETKDHIESIADTTLSLFERVASAARSALRRPITDGKNVLASLNTLTSVPTVKGLGHILQEGLDSYRLLEKEPAIARVVIAYPDGSKRTYYICRTTPIEGMADQASYRSQLGRLASLPIGASLPLPGGRTVRVLEKASLRPVATDREWDSHGNVIEGEHLGPITIESFRTLLKQLRLAEPVEDLLEQLLSEESQAINVIEGIRRSVITKMALRDQPILDQYQDEIFRLPLDRRVLLLGPAGTGKTTTLIRRLGQKLDTAYLTDDEKVQFDRATSSTGETHGESWLMFTPTELLKQYLKEAFAREGVPASDLRIRTWSDYRRELARNVFGVLRTAAGGGPFVLKDSAAILTNHALGEPNSWFSDFDKTQRSAYVGQLQRSAQTLTESQSPSAAELGRRLVSVVQLERSGSLIEMFTSLAAISRDVQVLLTTEKEATDRTITGYLNLQMNRNKGFIEELAKYLDSLQQVSDSESEDLEEQDTEDEEIEAPRTGRAAAATAYLRAVRRHARTVAMNRSLGRNTRTSRIIEWLGDRGIGDKDRSEVGASLIIQANARQFINPVKRFIDGVPNRYRAFRRNHQESGDWYQKDGFAVTDLHPLESDVVLLAILRGASELLSSPTVSQGLALPFWSPLRTALDRMKNQVLVDEATDFSPIQLGCMAALSSPRIRSFFACGDFNQRITPWGCRSIEDLKPVLPELDVRRITIAYRQSRQLNDLARAIILAFGGDQDAVTLPANVDSEGIEPALLEGAPGRPVIVGWLADRIREIERFVHQMPSIAIFVESEDEVQPIADALNDALANENAQVVACPKGQVMGQDNDVRVFDVQYIKGLEFEAVFFIGVDRLADLHPDLYDKYLYVGATRAATYLGLTCDVELPSALSSLRASFVPNWSTP